MGFFDAVRQLLESVLSGNTRSRQLPVALELDHGHECQIRPYPREVPVPAAQPGVPDRFAYRSEVDIAAQHSPPPLALGLDFVVRRGMHSGVGVEPPPPSPPALRRAVP